MTDVRPRHSGIYWRQVATGTIRAACLADVDDADVIVVGGGLAGLSTAWRLVTARPDRRVVVLEARDVAGGASGRAAGIVPQFPLMAPWLVDGSLPDGRRDIALDALHRLHRANLEHLRGIGAAGGPANMVITSRWAIAARLLGWMAERARDVGVTMRTLSAADASDLLGRRCGGGVVQPGVAVHPVDLTLAIAAQVERHGGLIVEDAPVDRVEPRRTHVACWVRGRPVRARRVVIAGNAYLSDALLRTVAIARSRRAHSYALVTGPLDRRTRDRLGGDRLMHGDIGAGMTYQRFHDGRLLFGALDVRGLEPDDGSAFDPHQIGRLVRIFRRAHPALASTSVDWAWGGAFLTPAAEAPIVRRSPVDERVIVNTGYAGAGIALASASGLTAAGLVDPALDTADAALLRSAFAITRLPPAGLARTAIAALRQ